MRARTLLVLTLLLCTVSPPAFAQAEGALQKVVIVSRHGVRTPIGSADELANWAAQPWPVWQQPAGALTPRGAQLATLMGRWYRDLARRGRWPDEEAGSDPFAAQTPLFASVVAASLQGRVALGPRARQPVRRLRSAAPAPAPGRYSARLEGFSLHANVVVPARRRDQLGKVCRYIVRPPWRWSD